MYPTPAQIILSQEQDYLDLEEDSKIIRNLESDVLSWTEVKDLLSELSFVSREEIELIDQSVSYAQLLEMLADHSLLKELISDMVFLKGEGHGLSVSNSVRIKKYHFSKISINYTKKNLMAGLNTFSNSQYIEKTMNILPRVKYQTTRNKVYLGEISVKFGYGLLIGSSRKIKPGLHIIRSKESPYVKIRIHNYSDKNTFKGVGLLTEEGPWKYWAIFPFEATQRSILGVHRSLKTSDIGLTSLSMSRNNQRITGVAINIKTNLRNFVFTGEKLFWNNTEGSIVLRIDSKTKLLKTGTKIRSIKGAPGGLSNPQSINNHRDINENGISSWLEAKIIKTNFSLFLDNYKSSSWTNGIQKGVIKEGAIKSKIEPFNYSLIFSSKYQSHQEPQKFLGDTKQIETISEKILAKVHLRLTNRLNSKITGEIKSEKGKAPGAGKSFYSSLIYKNQKLHMALSFGAISCKAKGPKMYIYGFSLPGESPAILFTKSGIVLSTQIRIKNKFNDQIAFRGTIKKIKGLKKAQPEVAIMLLFNK